MQPQQSSMNLSDMRARLQASRQAPQSGGYDFSQSPQAQVQFTQPPLSVSYEDERAQKMESLKGRLTHLHLYWHIYAVVGFYCLLQAMMLFPDIFPGMAGVKTPYQMGAPIIGLLIPAVMCTGLFVILRGFRRSLQNAAKITEAKGWSKVEWTGAAIGFAAMFYMAFLYAGPLDSMMLEEYRHVPFQLTPREWIMAVVKCLGGAVGGAILSRRFFGSGA